MSDIMSYLFETKAIRFCEENKPFWYTSGKIGPYFITLILFMEAKKMQIIAFFYWWVFSCKMTLPEKVFQKSIKTI